MAVNANGLSRKTTTDSNDYLVLFNNSTNEGSKMAVADYAGHLSVGNSISLSGKLSDVGAWIKTHFRSNTWIYARVNNVTAQGPFGSSSFSIEANCSSNSYGWAILRSDNPNFGGMIIGRLSGDWKWYTVSTGVMNNPDGNNEQQTITYGGKTWNFYKSGRFVYFNATDDANDVPSGFTVIGTLNEAFRPSSVVRFGPQNTSRSAWLELYADGRVRLYNSSAITSATNFAFVGCYMANS